MAGTLVARDDGEADKGAVMDRVGATREAYLAKVVSKLDAKSVIVDKFGDEHSVDDNATQMRAAEMIAKLRGDMKENVVDNRVYNTVIQASSVELEAFKAMVDGVHRELRELRVDGRQTGEVITDAEVING